jgi:phospholipid transport system substrate-binding protein
VIGSPADRVSRDNDMSDKRLITDPVDARRSEQQSIPARVSRHETAMKPTRTSLAMLAKGFTLALAVIAGLSAGPRPAAADEAPAEAPIGFIRDLGNQALAVITSDILPAGKAAYFERMIHQDFDLSGISRFELGPYWRIASPTERQEFCDLFADHLVRLYGRRLGQFGDGSFIVTGSRSDPAGVIVTSRIIRQWGPPLAIDWRLGVSDGLYKIEDLAIDGVSMALAQRSAIAAIIARDGGQFGLLLATMREED